MRKIVDLIFDKIVQSTKKRRGPVIILCVYHCEQDRHLLPKFYTSSVIEFIRKRFNVRILEVTANPEISESFISGTALTLKTYEDYANLPNKTFKMISFLTTHAKFDYILKIDVTTLTKSISENIKTGGLSITNQALIDLVSCGDFFTHYNGFVKLNAKREGAENWASKKGLTIDYDMVFESDLLPEFYSGKFWLISRDFAQFISKHGSSKVQLFTKYFPAEDVMIGCIFNMFRDRYLHVQAKHKY